MAHNQGLDDDAFHTFLRTIGPIDNSELKHLGLTEDDEVSPDWRFIQNINAPGEGTTAVVSCVMCCS
jgi:hypothetical protein